MSSDGIENNFFVLIIRFLMFYGNLIFRIFSKLNAVLLLKLKFYNICKPYNILNSIEIIETITKILIEITLNKEFKLFQIFNGFIHTH